VGSPFLLQVLLGEDGIGSVLFLFSLLTLLRQFVCFFVQVGLGSVFAFGIVRLAGDIVYTLNHKESPTKEMPRWLAGLSHRWR
jgi:hypothetical protein